MILEKDFLFRHFHVIREGVPKEVTSIAVHSQKVSKNSLFVALKGEKEDGHSFLKEAAERGAAALLVEETSQVPLDFKGIVLKTEDGRSSLSFLLNEFYDFPSRKLFTVGITGTNGKTTTASMIEYLFCNCGWKTGLIGSVEQRCGDKKWSSFLTTPEPVELFERLKDFLDLEAKALVMEVSSIGLQQKRAEGMDFNIGLFTNLSRDHMDYHKNSENYFQSKKRLFYLMKKTGKNNLFIINRDDKGGERLLKELKGPCLTFGREEGNFSFKIKKESLDKTLFEIFTPKGMAEILLPVPGLYNVYNAVGALAASLMAGFSLDSCKKALESFPGVRGRLELITPKNHPFKVFVDYAHTPDALGTVLKTLKNQAGKGRVVVVFGCGGGRDRGKRGEMARTALKLSDKVVFTSDNPRYESPEQILKDSLSGVQDKSSLQILWDRRKAIEEVITKAKPRDLIVVAGKGHETFQIIRGKKYPFSDKKVIEESFNLYQKPGQNS